jgi:hypothetical protein
MSEEIPFQQIPLEEIPAPTPVPPEELEALHEGMRKEFVEMQERSKRLREYSRNMMAQGVQAASQSNIVQEISEPAPSEPAPSEQENPET